jgi:N6-adenosine-specific RNA methylase IME4
MTEQSNSLIHFDTAKKELALAKSVDEVKNIRDKAEALRAYAKQAGESLEMQNMIAEIKIRAERRAGELLKEQKRDQGETDKKIMSDDSTLSSKPKLDEIGISKNQSSSWQKIADIPEDKFEKHIAETKDSKEELTTASTLRLAEDIVRQERNQTEADMKANAITPEFPVTKFNVIVIDPPWDVQKIIREVRPNQKEFDYPTMTIQEIKDLPILDLADDICTLFLWTIDKYLYQAKDILEFWGFQYHLTMAWDKGNGISLYGFHRQTEFVLVGFKGTHETYPERKTIRTSFTGKSPFHSAKPDEFYEMLEVLEGNKIDIFARKQREGWTVYGNEL